MREINTPIIPVTQPIGTFYLGKVKASELRDALVVKRRTESSLGVQRDVMASRIRDIKEYCGDSDATFPTSIIIGVDTLREDVTCTISDDKLHIKFDTYFGSVIDGQHRLQGILSSELADAFELPVVFMIDPTVEDEAYIFSIINSTQCKVSPSLIYDLFDVMSTRSPKKTVHDIARALNGRQSSPFFNRLKMLGKRTDQQTDATLSQGTFGKRLLKLISNNADEDARRIKSGLAPKPNENLIFRMYFIENQDDVIMKILLNCFNALRQVFPNEWEHPHEYILWKTTGYNAVIDSLPIIYRFGVSRKNLTEMLFESVFKELKAILIQNNYKLNSQYFGSGESETKHLKDLICDAVDKSNSKENL